MQKTFFQIFKVSVGALLFLLLGCQQDVSVPCSLMGMDDSVNTIPVTTNYVNIRWQEGNNLYYANSGFKGLNINQTKTIPIESDFAKITLQHNNYGFESIVGAHADSFGIIPEACEYNNSLTVRFYVVQF